MTKANYNFEQGAGKKALLTAVSPPLVRHPLCHPLDLSTMSQASSDGGEEESLPAREEEEGCVCIET